VTTPAWANAALSAPAKQNEGFHWAFSVDVDGAVRLQPKALVDVPMGCSRDLDAVRHAMRLHATGDVHRIAPDVVDELVSPYDPGHHVARMHFRSNGSKFGNARTLHTDGQEFVKLCFLSHISKLLPRKI